MGEVVIRDGVSSYQIHIVLYCLDAHQQLARVFFTQIPNRWQHQTAETVGAKSLHKKLCGTETDVKPCADITIII